MELKMLLWLLIASANMVGLLTRLKPLMEQTPDNTKWYVGLWTILMTILNVSGFIWGLLKTIHYFNQLY